MLLLVNSNSCLIVVALAGALRVLQRLHIIHRDIKPQNLLLSYPVAGGNGSTAGRKDRPFQEASIKLGACGVTTPHAVQMLIFPFF